MRFMEVRDWREAQRAVTFPVHRPLPPTTRITVRPWSARLWPTVASVHEFRGATLRLKQLVDPWGPSVFPPLLSYMAGNPGGGGDRLYGPPLTVFHLGRMPVAHAGHYYGKEAGLALAHMVALDLVVQRGRLGAEGLRSFLKGLAWADARGSPARYARPLFEWSWSLSEQRHMWSYPISQPWERRLAWSGPVGKIAVFPEATLLPPRVPGFRLDCVGVGGSAHGGDREARLYYRPLVGHQPLVVTYLRGTPPPKLRGGPIYRAVRARVADHRALAVRAPSVGSSTVSVELSGEERVVLTVPSPMRRASPGRDLRVAIPFVRAFDRRE